MVTWPGRPGPIRSYSQDTNLVTCSFNILLFFCYGPRCYTRMLCFFQFCFCYASISFLCCRHILKLISYIKHSNDFYAISSFLVMSLFNHPYRSLLNSLGGRSPFLRLISFIKKVLCVLKLCY